MTIFTGEQGFVELRRTNEDNGITVRDNLNPADVNTSARRFSVDKNGVGGMFLLTGDRVRIENLSAGGNPTGEPWLLESHTNAAGEHYHDWTGYVGVDAIGGIRLFDRYEKAITNQAADALALAQPRGQIRLEFEQRNVDYKGLAGITSYDFTTERETIDVTRLGDAFRKQFEAGLITGQGSLDCLWQHEKELCDNLADCNDPEFAIFLSQLCVRVITGARFTGRFIIYYNGANSVFYEAACVVTNASINVEPGQIVSSSIQFVTTGVIQLKVGRVPGVIIVDSADGLRVAQDALLTESLNPVFQDD